jgi:PPOX class probable FMN-dependent enzyme
VVSLEQMNLVSDAAIIISPEFIAADLVKQEENPLFRMLPAVQRGSFIPLSLEDAQALHTELRVTEGARLRALGSAMSLAGPPRTDRRRDVIRAARVRPLRPCRCTSVTIAHTSTGEREVVPNMAATGVAEDGVATLHAHRVQTLDELYALNGEPSDAIANKHTSYLTPLLEAFIRASPFFLVATADAEGNCDVSPKGDPAGAVKILDHRTIAIPDRPGNRRIDGHRNVIANPHVGLIFIIPNVDETLRINGRAFLTAEPELLASMAIEGRAPKLAIVVEIDEAYMHCARAFLRSGLWQPEMWPNPDTVPTLRAIMCEQKDLPPPDESHGKRQEEYRSVLY